MGSTYNPAAILSGYRSTDVLNDQLELIAADLADKVDRNGVTPNQMEADFDMNSNRILNLGNGVTTTDGVNLGQVQNIVNSAVAAAGGFNTTEESSAPLTFNYGIASGDQGTSGNTVYDLTSLFIVSAINGLTVVVNGVVQMPNIAYTVDVSANVIVTFAEALEDDTEIMFIYGDLSPTPILGGIVADAQISYDISAYFDGVPDNGSRFTKFVTPRDFHWNANFSGSYGQAEVAATGSSVFTIKVDGVSAGTATFAGAATTATFSGSALDVSAGSVVTIDCPATADATLEGIAITLFGYQI